MNRSSLGCLLSRDLARRECSPLVQHLVQVQHRAGQHRPRRQLRRRQLRRPASSRRRRSASSPPPASPAYSARRSSSAARSSASSFASGGGTSPGGTGSVEPLVAVLPPSLQRRARPARATPRRTAGRSAAAAPASGVLVRSRRAMHASRDGASNVRHLRRRRRSASRTCTGCGGAPSRRPCPATKFIVLLADVRHRPPQARRLRRLHLRPAQLLDQQPARRQRLVAQHLGVEAEARAARQQAVGRVLRQPAPSSACDDWR